VFGSEAEPKPRPAVKLEESAMVFPLLLCNQPARNASAHVQASAREGSCQNTQCGWRSMGTIAGAAPAWMTPMRTKPRLS
jgi:hypothetical protein